MISLAKLLIFLLELGLTIVRGLLGSHCLRFLHSSFWPGIAFNHAINLLPKFFNMVHGTLIQYFVYKYKINGLKQGQEGISV